MKYLNEIINADCMDILPSFSDKSIDLVIADSPYGIRKEAWDEKEYFKNNIKKWLHECLRISKTVIWFCADKYLPLLLEGENDFNRCLVWIKPSGTQFAGSHHSNLWYSVEFILVFGKIPKTDKTKKYGYAHFEYRTVPFKEFEHPSVKPLGLIKELVYYYSQEGDLVCDPFAGSCTTCVAAKMLNRNYIGIEKDPSYFETAKKRLSHLENQGKLF